DAGLELPRDDVRRRIDAIYKQQGLEYQRVFDELLEGEQGEIDPKILASGIVAYRRARGSAMVLYPHVQMTLLELAKGGIRVGGKSLGMTTVFARYGDTFQTQESGADYDIDDVYQLVAIVDALNGVTPSSTPSRPAARGAANA